ncbi:ABC transporter substrate-binding protein [Frankia sp. CNm7]|uniref:ABC transporter substrate-binding protein n=1 Tax=Frankia nepalensis TaxID=1836974 RepID=A0A937RIP4_9ACTN|nr:ABC transporter substrate-binding protein [Frankia nepalensis]MBL7497637.1 ABC transporter substrate-binding protein [Frankia nepalensis]MBL7510049.1 ABC transporter substrate-binding protein [Frankia nepalensis]MBL7517541.1 ABC transporter substrate-binding protein [Frankia nepalensis]MBL7631070.1 ABC transporter substrate-binding protein [Frankia nepalensis]
MRALRLVTVLAASAALATGLAACGDDDAGTTAPQPTIAAEEIKAGPATGWSDGGFTPDPSTLDCKTTAANPTRGVTDTEIKIGGLAYLTSTNGSTMAGVDLGAKARFERANAEGGINGRRINFIGVMDDGNDASRNISQANVLAKQQQVFAVVPVITSFANFVDTFCADTVPFFGWGINKGFCDNTIGFGITGCLLPEKRPASATTYGIMLQSLNNGDATGLKVALLGSDTDSSVIGIKDMNGQIKTVGADVVYAENPVPTSGITDATPIVNKIMTSADGGPPDVILYATDFTSTTKMIEAMQAAGYEGKHLTTVGYDPRLAAVGFQALQKSYSMIQWSPAEDTSPAVQQLVADVKKYTPEATLSQSTMAGYWAADMFVTAATKVGRDLTVDSLLKLLNDDYSNYVEGALPETRYPLNHFVNAPCASMVQLDGKAYNVTAKLSCGALLKI